MTFRMFVGVPAAGGGPVVTITNHTNTAFNVGANATAAHTWVSDGTLDAEDNGSATQINASTDWIIPNAAASSSYRIRHTAATGDTGDWSPAGTINTWLAIASTRTYIVTDTTAIGADPKSVDYTVEIDDGSGTALDSGNMTLIADREDF